jgi:hypothetical protein
MVLIQCAWRAYKQKGNHTLVAHVYIQVTWDSEIRRMVFQASPSKQFMKPHLNQ